MTTPTILWALLIALIFSSWPIVAKYCGAGFAWVSTIIYAGGLLVVVGMGARKLLSEQITWRALITLVLIALFNGFAVWMYSMKAVDKGINTSLFMITGSLGGIVIAPILNWMVNKEILTFRQWIGVGLAMVVVWLMKK